MICLVAGVGQNDHRSQGNKCDYVQRVLGPIALHLVVGHLFICPVNEPDSSQTQNTIRQEKRDEKLVPGTVVVSELPLEVLNLEGLVFADTLLLRARVWLKHRVGEKQPKVQTDYVDEIGQDQEVHKIAHPPIKFTLQESVLDSSFEVLDREDPKVKEANTVETHEKVGVLEISVRADNQIKLCAGEAVKNNTQIVANQGGTLPCDSSSYGHTEQLVFGLRTAPYLDQSVESHDEFCGCAADGCVVGDGLVDCCDRHLFIN